MLNKVSIRKIISAAILFLCVLTAALLTGVTAGAI